MFNERKARAKAKKKQLGIPTNRITSYKDFCLSACPIQLFDFGKLLEFHL